MTVNVPTINDTKNAILLAFATTGCFILLNKTFIRFLPTILKKISISQPERLNSYEFVWKYSNILISLIHSFVSGSICFYSVLYYPSLHQDIIDAYASLPYYALAFTVGYFLYDFYDIFVHRHFYSQYVEIVMHHSMIIMNFGLSVVQCRYIGSMIIGLLSEVHNVFLHNRTLYRMSGFNRERSIYHMLIHGNMCTMFLFRTLPYLYILCKFSTISLTGQPYVALPVSILFWVSILLLFTYNMLLFQRILNTDYFQRQKPCKTSLNSAGDLHLFQKPLKSQ